MATEEARAMLDALMGGDRNALLPPGAAIPHKRKHGEATSGNGSNGGSMALLLPGKRQKSCFDKDIDPLYTAWGVDVYDLFVNTKSDLGANPYIVDEGAHREFKSLSPEEQERTGYNYFLFQKLQELVRQCDRTVARNQEKLQQELQRKLSQRGGQDFVEDVDEAAVESLLRDMFQADELKEEWAKAVAKLDQVVLQEEAAMKKLEPLLEAKKSAQDVANAQEQQMKEVKEEAPNSESIKEEMDESKVAVTPQQPVVKQEEGEPSGESATADTVAVKQEQGTDDDSSAVDVGSLHMELGRLTLQKQRLVFDIGNIISRLVPLQEAVESQHRNLNYVKSDISTDKTVCEVSGNFMSSRDADERIAAHYSGKQYVGWKLVRDKLASMIKQYGRYGPPPPQAGPRDGGGPPPRRGMVPRASPPPPRGVGNFDRGGGRFEPNAGGGGGGGFRGGDRGGGGGGRFDRHGPSPGFQGRGGPPPPRGGNWRR